MGRDTDELRARLRVASLLLLTAAGCTAPPAPAEPVKPEPTPVATTPNEPPTPPTPEPTPVATTPNEPPAPPVPTPKPVPVRDRAEDPPRATCPTVSWTVTLAEANAETLGKPPATDCPPEHRGPFGSRGSLVGALHDGKCTYTGTKPCPGGRPLLDDGRPLVADVVADAAWSGPLLPADPRATSAGTSTPALTPSASRLAAASAGTPTPALTSSAARLAAASPTLASPAPRLGAATPALDPPAPLRAALAAAWLEDARSEHASVASFARATLELLALAAPPALVAACQRAGLDEVEHARVCFALAAGYAGAARGPGPLPAVAPRPADLVRLACDTFVEGCVGETTAALAAARAARRCADPAVAAALARISDDEADHAALAWATVAWAAGRGGEPVRAALRALADRLHADVLAAAAPPADPDADLLARHGRLDLAARHACERDAWAQLIAPAVDELA